MKSCYIANCDKSCDFDNSRSLFMVPTAPEAIALWKAVVPENRRPLTKGDKLCHRHFQESDIERYFEHTINGETFQMLRDRPRLSKTAVPSLNLHIVLGEKDSTKRKDDRQNPAKKKKNQITEEDIQSISKSNGSIENKTENIIIEFEKTNAKFTRATEGKSANCTSNVKESCEKINQQKRKDFEALYEEVFAVQLPSQLWGIHRCPEMRFIAFSRFDAESLRTDLVVYISDLWEYTVSFKGLNVKQKCLSAMTEDSITVLLDEVDSARYYLNDKCDKVHVKRKYIKNF
ncbi:uncharacterized protein LOC134833831 [Culicoides brevitarsis]|uniref:uncharacterized protein LOC134833831 n=1 Tax=Culicoides brevitarsis TaxID=469753 RepID=UPI00307C8196